MGGDDDGGQEEAVRGGLLEVDAWCFGGAASGLSRDRSASIALAKISGQARHEELNERFSDKLLRLPYCGARVHFSSGRDNLIMSLCRPRAVPSFSGFCVGEARASQHSTLR